LLPAEEKNPFAGSFFCAALTEHFAPVAPVEPLFSAFLPKKPQLAIFNII
jgi:hypothetical protein